MTETGGALDDEWKRKGAAARMSRVRSGGGVFLSVTTAPMLGRIHPETVPAEARDNWR